MPDLSNYRQVAPIQTFTTPQTYRVQPQDSYLRVATAGVTLMLPQQGSRGQIITAECVSAGATCSLTGPGLSLTVSNYQFAQLNWDEVKRQWWATQVPNPNAAPPTITMGGDVSGTATAAVVTGLQGRPVAATAPAINYVLAWSGSNWAPSAIAAVGGGTVTQINTGVGLTGGPITTSGTLSVATAGVTNALLANMPATTLKGNNTALAAAPLDLTTAQLQTMLGYLTGNQTITLSGDTTGAGTTAIITTTGRVNGVTYPASPVTNTVPVVTGTNAVTYQLVPVAAGGTGLASGTSGGIPYYSAAASIASSAALGAGLVVTGGGAGTAPATIANGQLPATTTNDNAAAGKVGEYVATSVLSGSAISLTNATVANLMSLSLTAGDWDVDGNVSFQSSAAAISQAAISATSLGFPDQALRTVFPQVTGNNVGGPVLMERISIAATTTVYLVVYSSFASGTCTASGALIARRVR